MSDIKFYTSEKVTERVTAIRSMTGELMYLIKGDNKALLMDTCIGVGHLKDFVETLTDKPITVVITHGHIDHAMGAAEFSDVYMSHLDLPMFREMTDIKGRKGYLIANLSSNAPKFDDSDFVDEPEELSCKDLKDGDSFDLGGVHADIYAFPGHTKGTMTLLIREERILITGDACNNATFIWDEENSSTVETYLHTLEKYAEKLDGKYDRIFMCHHVMEADPKLLYNVIEVCKDVLDGKSDEVPFEFMGNHCLIAKKANQRFERLDGGFGNIIYSKNRVRD